MSKLRSAVNNVKLRRFRFWLQIAFLILFVYGGYFAINLGNNLPTFACGFNQEGRGGVCFLLPLQHLQRQGSKRCRSKDRIHHR